MRPTRSPARSKRLPKGRTEKFISKKVRVPGEPGRLAALVTMTLVLLGSGNAIAQPPAAAVRLAIGSAKPYLDEPWQLAISGSILFPLNRRLGLEPEVAISDGERFRIWTFIPSISYAFADRDSPVVFYVTGGIGYFHELDKSIGYGRTELAWNGGLGLRARVTRRLFISPDFRVGHVSRFTVGLGYWF